ncbi:ABC transporter permease [Actinoallomurus sp. NPDC050550]|uniref:ABC transporter permease n=1 Tax=Actinoallomurus sp. NPDC050550 TaxID=3154937 RepID=UPI0033D89BE9
MTDVQLAVPGRDAWSTRLRDIGFWAEWAALIGLVVLVVVFQSLNSTFLSTGNVQSMLVAAAILIILAVGQTFVISTAGIDLSVASTMTLGAVVFGQAYTSGWGLPLSAVVAVVASAVLGVVNGTLIARGRIADFIVTLGTLSAASGLALILSNGKPVTIVDPFLLRLSTGGVGIFGWSFIIAAVVAVLAHVMLFHSRFGTHVLATGGAPESATAMGISTRRIKIAVYTISGTLAGLGAILLVARVGAAEPAANTAFLLNSVAAVVLGGVSLFGGRGTITGPVIGALLLTALVNGLTLLGVSQFYQPLAVGIVVVLAALMTRFQR